MSSIDICPTCGGLTGKVVIRRLPSANSEGIPYPIAEVPPVKLCPGHPETKVSRDTQFAGFAKALLDELLSIQGVFIDTVYEEWREWWEETIAQRAHDLVGHTFDNTGPMMLDCYSHEEQIAAIPDLTTFPEETK